MISWIKRLYRRLFPNPSPEWQWTPAERAIMQKQREAGLVPPLTINKIKLPIDSLDAGNDQSTELWDRLIDICSDTSFGYNKVTQSWQMVVLKDGVQYKNGIRMKRNPARYPSARDKEKLAFAILAKMDCLPKSHE